MNGWEGEVERANDKSMGTGDGRDMASGSGVLVDVVVANSHTLGKVVVRVADPRHQVLGLGRRGGTVLRE